MGSGLNWESEDQSKLALLLLTPFTEEDAEAQEAKLTRKRATELALATLPFPSAGDDDDVSTLALGEADSGDR